MAEINNYKYNYSLKYDTYIPTQLFGIVLLSNNPHPQLQI